MRSSTTPVIFPPGHPLDSPECRCMLSICLRRLRRWRVPPHWSAADWYEEINLEAMTAAQEASLAFDASHGIPLEWFIRNRVLNRALQFYRKEWAYGRRCSTAGQAAEYSGPDIDAPSAADDSVELLSALNRLSDADRWLVEQLFWKRVREADVAETLKISQQAVNRRKQLILLDLRKILAAPTTPVKKIRVVKSQPVTVIRMSSRQGQVKARVHHGGSAG